MQTYCIHTALPDFNYHFDGLTPHSQVFWLLLRLSHDTQAQIARHQCWRMLLGILNWSRKKLSQIQCTLVAADFLLSLLLCTNINHQTQVEIGAFQPSHWETKSHIASLILVRVCPWFGSHLAQFESPKTWLQREVSWHHGRGFLAPDTSTNKRVKRWIGSATQSQSRYDKMSHQNGWTEVAETTLLVVSMNLPGVYSRS